MKYRRAADELGKWCNGIRREKSTREEEGREVNRDGEQCSSESQWCRKMWCYCEAVAGEPMIGKSLQAAFY